MVEGGVGVRDSGRKGGKSNGGDRDLTAGVTDAAAEEEEDMDIRMGVMDLPCYKRQQFIKRASSISAGTDSVTFCIFLVG